MSYLRIVKKTNHVYVWPAVDRVRGQVVDFEITNSREFSAYLPMAQSLELRYDIEIACSDHYDVYDKYRIAKKHYMTKA